MSAKMNGVVLYRGESRINGRPIAVVATFHSANEKTGDMIQTWVLSDEGRKPTDAIKEDLDVSICGGCVHRGIGAGKLRSCYVNAGRGPRQIYEAYRAGAYPDATASILARHASGRLVRLGAYGDPAAVPMDVWTGLLRYTRGRTGYTHLWREEWAQAYRHLLMASCDSEADRIAAKGMGWRTFRVRLHDAPILPGEIVCPAAPEGQYRRNCDTCLACDGFSRAGQADVVIIGHGAAPILSNVKRNLDALANV